MASHTVAAGDIGTGEQTLVADTADTVTFEDDVDRVEIVNVDGAAALSFTADGRAATVNGEQCYYLPATICSLVVEVQTPGGSEVSIISSGTPKFVVQRG